jgi:small-conductance mechanosensitive channel
MQIDLLGIFENIWTIIVYWVSLLLQPWTFIQIGILVAIYFISLFVSNIIEPPIEVQARKLKVSKGTLRLIVALLRRLEWVVFVFLSWVAFSILRATTWTSHSYLVSIAVSLASAWLVIAVLSHVIRSRSIAKMVAIFGWCIVALSIVGWLDDVQVFLDAAALTIGDFKLSALAVIQGVVLIVGLLWFATGTGNYADRRINEIEDLAPSLKVLLGKLIKISLVIAALVIAFSSVGFDLTALTIFSGAVGVGIGFGLQKVVSNFISGIIILLDKSIKPGDTKSLGDTFGWIR